MKKVSLLTLLLALCFSFLQAQFYNLTLTGQVTDLSNGSPIANHAVSIYLDSTNFLGFSYYSTVTTDINGVYTDVITIPGGVSGGTGSTMTRDCTPSGMLYNNFSYVGGNSTISNLDFAICVTQQGACQANFAGSPVPGSLLYNFSDLSTSSQGNVSSWSWSFGDGDTSSLQNPSHTYNTPGAYVVCLTTNTTLGCTSTYCDSILVSGGGGGISCNASLTGTIAPNGVASFSTSASGTGSIVSYTYDFGDGSAWVTGGSTINHTYAAAGNYVACVYVDFSDSCRASDCMGITVSSNLPCQAGYYWFPDSSGQFSIIVVNTSTGSNPTYLWSFGDGTTSTQANPSHTYSGPGSYGVCVTITTSNPSCTSVYCDTLVVVNKVNAPFTINVVSSTATAVAPQVATTSISLYPNPARDFFQVDMDLVNSNDVKVTLMDLSGKVVSTVNAGNLGAGTQSLRVSTQDLPAGLYMARIQTGESFSTHKVMIAR